MQSNIFSINNIADQHIPPSAVQDSPTAQPAAQA